MVMITASGPSACSLMVISCVVRRPLQEFQIGYSGSSLGSSLRHLLCLSPFVLLFVIFFVLLHLSFSPSSSLFFSICLPLRHLLFLSLFIFLFVILFFLSYLSFFLSFIKASFLYSSFDSSVLSVSSSLSDP